jgi:muramidase (phage lysozyme)
MADNIPQDLSDALERLRDSLDDLVTVTASTGAGMNNLGATAGTSASQQMQLSREERRRAQLQEQGYQALSKATSNLAGSMFNAAKAMYEGQKGATAFNSSLDNLSEAAVAAGTALALLLPGGPLVKGLIAGLTFITTKLIGTAKAAGEMSDALYKGYQGLSQSGAAASDGLTGLLADVHKLGMGFQDLDRFNSMIAEGRKELVLFGGTVFAGRQRFADLGMAMQPFRESLMNAGMTQEEINEASMGYIRLQSRIGQTQNRTTQELAEGARRYLIEQDALTKLTGLSRKEQEDAREEIRSQERFAAQLAELRAKGDKKSLQAAKDLEDVYLVLYSQNKLAAQGFADLSTGMITTEAAQKSMLGTQGESMRVSQLVQAGQLEVAEAAQRVAAAHGRTAESMRPLAQMGVYGNAIGDFAGDLRLRSLSDQNIAEQLKKIEEDRIKQGVEGGKAADKQQQQQTDLRLAQQEQMKATQKLVSQAIEPSMTAFQKLSNIVANVTLAFEKLLRLIPGVGDVKTDEQLRAREEVAKAESALQTEKTNLIAAERQLLAAKRTGDKLAIEAAEKTLEASKASKKQAESKLLDAEVKQKYADDRASGRTGAGMGGQQLRADGSMINPGDADYVPPAPAGGAMPSGAPSANVTEKLLDYIGRIESQGNYNVLVGGKTKSDLTDMTVAQVLEFQKTMREMGHESTAVGKYQIIQKTLEGLVAQGAVKLEDKFNPSTQDRLAVALMRGRGLDRYQSGNLSAAQFADNLAREWASLPLATGRSAYQGVGSNKSLVSRDDFMKVFADKGGVFTGPKSGYDAILHGTEAVVPLPDGKTIPVSMSNTGATAADNTEMLQALRELKVSMDSMVNRADNQRVVDALENSIRTQRASNDILGKILQMSQ